MTLVLVVDDSNPDRIYTRQLLAAQGYEVIEALNGAEALERVKERPDVILLDVVMPVMDGFETLAALQADPEAAFIPVLLLTGRDSQDDVARGLQLGAHDFLHKPVGSTELVARVGAAARVRSLYSQLRAQNADLELFARHVAHDLKSPLSIIRGYARYDGCPFNRHRAQRLIEPLKHRAAVHGESRCVRVRRAKHALGSECHRCRVRASAHAAALGKGRSAGVVEGDRNGAGGIRGRDGDDGNMRAVVVDE